MSGQLTSSHRRLVTNITDNAELTKLINGVRLKQKNIYAADQPAILCLISHRFCDSRSGALQQDTQCLHSQAGPNQHCPEEMGMISQMEVVSDVGLWALLAPAFPHGSRPLAVFIGDSVRSLAACIPLPLPTQW